MKQVLKHLFLGILSITLLNASSCSSEPEIRCFPERISTTYLEGGASKLFEDFFYNEDGSLNKINRSDYITYYYSYDERGKLKTVTKKNVQEFLSVRESYTYDEELADTIEIYHCRLDPYSKEEIDTSYIGYRALEYSGKEVISETRYTFDERGNKHIETEFYEFSYDQNGNIAEKLYFNNSNNDTTEAWTYTYDYGKHPLNSMDIGFNGLSTVNNILSSKERIGNDSYIYEIRHNSNSYADNINVKIQYTGGGTDLIEITTVTYLCQ